VPWGRVVPRAREVGHGTGYEYPHDDPEVAGRVYYEPSGHGFEREVGERMRSANPNDAHDG